MFYVEDMTTTNPTVNQIPSTWDKLYELDNKVDFEAFLKSDLLRARQKENTVVSFIRPMAGSISLISSAAIIYHIFKSHYGFSTTYHRLMLGLSVADILSSCAHVISAVSVPEEMRYLYPHANGTTGSCTFRSIILIFGSIAGVLYNCSICMRYLAIIRYNKKDCYIKEKLEFWFHGISFIVPLVINIILGSQKIFNNAGRKGTFCFAHEYNPPHCIGYGNGSTPPGDDFHIPCGRGENIKNPISAITIGIARILILVVTPLVIFISMLLMYRSVVKISRRMNLYGGMSIVQGGNSVDEGIMLKLKRYIRQIIPCCGNGVPNHLATRSNNASSRKQTILAVAIGYSLAWLLTWLPYLLYLFLGDSFTAEFILALFQPLQGFYNLFVYLLPTARCLKRSRGLNWAQSYTQSWVSRGPERKNRALTSKFRKKPTIKNPSGAKVEKISVVEDIKKEGDGIYDEQELTPDIEIAGRLVKFAPPIILGDQNEDPLFECSINNSLEKF